LAVVLGFGAAEAKAESLQEYVTACKADLGFTDVPDMNCNEGVRFAFNDSGNVGLINDFIGSRRLAPYIDVTFACRWLGPQGPTGPFQTAASIELLIHNRQSGHTCFFTARTDTPTQRTSVHIVSPTNFNPVHDAQNPNADDFWMSPTTLNTTVPNAGGLPGATLKCVACHAAGPYIASPRIAPFLGQFGLLNNGHDDVAGTRLYQAVNGTMAGSAFNGWNAIIDGALTPSANTCASQCHSIADRSKVPSISGPGGQNLIPSIGSDIQAVANAGAMSLTRPIDDYRWMNVDIPDDANTTGDVELFYPLKQNGVGFSPKLNAALTCETEPAYMEARVVGSNVTVKTNEVTINNTGFRDVLEKFDQTGLICRNASQLSGTCDNYVVRFVCLPDSFSMYSRWTNGVVTIANPDANQIRWAKGQPYNTSWGPLSQKWQIQGVNDGVNFNYVRFYNPWLGVYLNADDSLAVSTAGLRNDWLSEQWVMEYVDGTHFVRFRNLWKTDMYLTMNEWSDYSTVNLQPLHPDWLAQQWELKSPQ